jgi:3-methyladenine DNA glycosylase Tag
MRLRAGIRTVHAPAIEAALAAAGADAGLCVVDACAIICGVRCIVRAHAPRQLRTFARRFVARAAALLASERTRWRPGIHACPIAESSAGSWRAFIARCRGAFTESMSMAVDISPGSAKKRGARRLRGTVRSRARRGAAFVRRIERTVDAELGIDEAAARLRRYVADHDAPADDAAAFGRMCEVIFAQGIGFAIVGRKREALAKAFAGFAPATVAAFSETDVRRILGEPVIRNAAKIRACIANAKRWCAAPQGSYLAYVASNAADDDPLAGWPQLAALVKDDFERLNDAGARQTLKRWGFFTAFGHPGTRRVIERLGLTDATAPAAEGQTLIGAIADVMSRDPYEIEGVLALFAARGPCAPAPHCVRCALVERCPSASIDR